MVFFSSARVVYSILFFVLASLLIVLAKPKFLFDSETGKPKPFGVGQGKTLFSLGVIILLVGVVTFFMFGLIDMMYACGEVSKLASSHPDPLYHRRNSSPIAVAEPQTIDRTAPTSFPPASPALPPYVQKPFPIAPTYYSQPSLTSDYDFDYGYDFNPSTI